MTTNTKNSTEITQQIKNQENELKDLLSLVIKSPLKPLETQITQLEKRLESVEAISKATSEVNLPAVQAAIRVQGEDAQKNFKGLRKAINEEFPELLAESLASMPQEITQLLQEQTSLKDLLTEVRQGQMLQAKQASDTFLQSESLLLKSFAQMNEINSLVRAAFQTSEKAVAQIDENRERIGENLDRVQAEGRLGMQQLGNGITALAGNLSSMPQEIGRLLEGQTLVKDLLSSVRQEQTLQGKLVGDTFRQGETLLLKSLAQTNEINNLAEAAVQASEKAVTQINESREHIRKNLDGIQADGRLGMQQLGNGITTLAGSLSRTSAQVTELAPTLAGRTDELGSRLESGFNSFRKQSEKERNELSSALQVMQKRFLWLSVLCGLSFAGSVGLVVSRFVLHV